MILGRKFKIWLFTFSLVLVAFLLYLSLGNTGSIKISKSDIKINIADANIVSDANSGRIGDARLGYLEEARFETIDPQTRKLERVIGFEKVLHKSGDQWELDKPFMNIFQKDLRCELTADTGTIELENIKGTQPSPKNAVLTGNVVIHIMPSGKSSKDDSFIYLNEVEFDGDRSMFLSDSKIVVDSKFAHLEGKGLEIVYNGLTRRLEYLEIKQVDFLNILETSKKEQASSNPVSDEPAASVEISKPQPEVKAIAAENSQNDYQCIFRDNVTIEYESNEVILADEISINKLLWSSEEDTKTVSAGSDEKVVSSGQVAGREVSAPAPIATTKVSMVQEMRVVAVVKCNGPMIVKPEHMQADSFSIDAFKSYSELDKNVIKWLGERNVLLSQRIDYDYRKQIARASGQVELVFYPKSADGSTKLPAVIDAEKSAVFVVAKKQAQFHGNVVGKMPQESQGCRRENVFYGDSLVVDIAGTQKSEDMMASGKVSHIEITGPGVRLESIKTIGSEKLSHVRLASKRIDYFAETQEIIAFGNGRIEYSKAVAKSSDSAKDNKPGYGLVEGFDELVWNTDKMHIMAKSERAGGIHMGYLPIEPDGTYGKKITVDTRRVDIDYIEPADSKAELTRLTAKGGIVYYEQDRYEFVGENLLYNALENYMTVAGSQETACMLNGVFVDGIEYNVKTGQAQAVLGQGVGVISVQE
ncbi:MAG: hypothetical protein K8R02_03700 [Anaerohalosphaeraceae bacterium]|nr:hypothetical protein [Anaerohalosphaeraceae bacterium]